MRIRPTAEKAEVLRRMSGHVGPTDVLISR